jgi:hypothetical protein
MLFRRGRDSVIFTVIPLKPIIIADLRRKNVRGNSSVN